MISMTSIEEIVKYQQELLNHQRNQKQIQKETIRLLNALNKNITFMSNRLDEFALRTNIKLEEDSNDVFFNNFYDSQLVTSSLNSAEDIKEFIVLNDCNLLEPSTNTSQPEPLLLIQQDANLNQLTSNLNNNNNNHLNNKNAVKLNNNHSKNVKSKLSSNFVNSTSGQRHRLSKLLDTTNTTTTTTTTTLATLTATSASRNATSDESVDDELSFDEFSDDEKETIQVKKKPKSAQTSNNQPQIAGKNKEVEESNNQQRLFNKYVRESVERRLGKEFLLLHEIQEIDHKIMEEIKSKHNTTEVTSVQELPPETLYTMATCNTLMNLDDELIGDPLEKAMLNAIEWNLTKNEVVVAKKPKSNIGWKIYQRYYFSSSLKRMSVIAGHSKPGSTEISYIATCKGAPEVLKTMIRDLPSKFDEIYLHFAREGARILCLGYKELGVLTHQQLRDLSRENVENELKFAGFVIISCPLKPDSKSVIKEIINSSHHLTMITGDNPLTACHVGAQLKFIDKKHALVLSKSEDATYEWRSVINDNKRKPLEYALTQKNLVKPSKSTPADADNVYNYLCLTGEVSLISTI